MDVYGLTGGIGSGKSTVAALLEQYGVPVVSADELSRVVVAPGSEGLAAVVAKFGPEVADDSGGLDRRRMASLVFGNAERRRELEAILHPRIRDRFEQVLDALEKAGHDVCVYEVPLLFERNLQGEMKAVVLVTAPLDARISRVRARDDVTETEVRARIAAQMDEDTKRRRADYIIENTGTLDDLRREVEFVMARFLRLGPSASTRSTVVQSDSGTVVTGNTMPPPSASEAPDEADSQAPPPSSTPTATPTTAEPPPSRRPTAVPTAASQKPTAIPTEPPSPAAVPPPDAASVAGPPTVVDAGPPKRASLDTVHPVTPASVATPPTTAGPGVETTVPAPPGPPAFAPPPPTGRPQSDRPTMEVAAIVDEDKVTQIDKGRPKPKPKPKPKTKTEPNPSE